MNIGIAFNNINKDGVTQLSHGSQLIKAELELLFNVPKHSLFFGNNFGLDLEKYLYMRNRKATYHLIKDDIVTVLNKYNKVDLKELVLIFKQDSKLDIMMTVVVKTTQEIIHHQIQLG